MAAWEAHGTDPLDARAAEDPAKRMAWKAVGRIVKIFLFRHGQIRPWSQSARAGAGWVEATPAAVIEAANATADEWAASDTAATEGLFSQDDLYAFLDEPWEFTDKGKEQKSTRWLSPETVRQLC